MGTGPSPDEIERLLEQLMPYLVIIAMVFSILSLLLTVLNVIIFCKLFHKTGRHWALGFLVLMPMAGLIILLFLAFGRWPVLEELSALKAAAAPVQPPSIAAQPPS